MAKKMRPNASRLYVNLAILIGGGVGLVLQKVLNLNNEAAFVLTVVTCSLAVALVHEMSYIMNRRRLS